MTWTAADRPITQDPQWFASWFDSIHYHRLYAYRDDVEAAGFVDELVRRLRPAGGARVLDLGCGAGRHSRFLASQGFRVTGIDLAARSIRKAKRFERPGLRFLRHDMRVPFGENAFDYVFNLFTSFGYFERADEHLAVVRNMADSLRIGGGLVVDYLNVRYAERRLVPEEMTRIHDVTYRVRRWTDAGHFFKQIVIEDARGGEPIEYVERVARFTLHDFRRMFARHGLHIVDVCGDYRLNPYDVEASPRMILIAKRTGSVPDAVSDSACSTGRSGLQSLPLAS